MRRRDEVYVLEYRSEAGLVLAGGNRSGYSTSSIMWLMRASSKMLEFEICARDSYGTQGSSDVIQL